MIITLEHYFLWFLFYSFVGWMYESILVSCQQHRLVNRGFLNGPLGSARVFAHFGLRPSPWR